VDRETFRFLQNHGRSRPAFIQTRYGQPKKTNHAVIKNERTTIEKEEQFKLIGDLNQFKNGGVPEKPYE